jgi:glycosyltransferase involved in cell wall biosynthesis
MKIAVNTRLLIKDRLDGMGWFSYETLSRITKSHPEHEFFFLFDRPYHRDFIFSDNIKPVILRPPARHPVLWFLWLEISVRNFLKKKNIDLFLSPDGFIPLNARVPSLAVVHDINFHHRPADLPLTSRKYYNYYFPKFVKKAAKIVTVSNYSAEDIVKSYGVERSKIDVVYNGVNDSFGQLSEELQEKTRKELTDGLPYFVFVGSLHPRKNVPNLLKAFDLFRRKIEKRVKLLVVGEKFFLTSAIENTLRKMEAREDVIFTGRLSAPDLHRVLASSKALTLVPYFEGFGIPVAEAMKCGVPVITSNVTSLPEVGGDTVLYADPDDTETISNHMKTIMEDEPLRESLIHGGLERVKKFSWDNSANSLWKSIEKVINETQSFL